MGGKAARGEFIGLEVEARKAPGAISGKVIDETKNMLIIRTEKGTKRCIKPQYAFQFVINNKKIIIDGKIIQSRPEDRVKTK